MRDSIPFEELDVVHMPLPGLPDEMVAISSWFYNDGVVEYHLQHGEGAGCIELETEPNKEALKEGVARMVELVKEQLEAISHTWFLWEMHLGWNWYLRLGFICTHCGRLEERQGHLVHDINWLQTPRHLEAHHGS